MFTGIIWLNLPYTSTRMHFITWKPAVLLLLLLLLLTIAIPG